MTDKNQAIVQLKSIVNNNYWQEQLKNVLGKNAGTFATSLMEVFSNDSKLIQCEPKSLMREAIKAASLKLAINKQLGYAYLVPFNNYNKETKTTTLTPTLVIGYKGYVQLAVRSGLYKNINADVVYEGELMGFDKLTGAIDLSGNKTSDKIVGFFAYFELVNGFNRTMFMTLEQMAKYALRYSPSFRGRNVPSVDNLMELAQNQVDAGVAGNGVGWTSDFCGMACKTVLRRLLSKYGYLSIEMEMAYTNEIENESAAMNERDEANNADIEEVNLVDADATEVAENTTEAFPE